MQTPASSLPSGYDAARASMLESQLRPNRVIDERLLAAVESLPRELFVPADKKAFAYIDEDIEIAKGRWLLEPMVQARLIQAAQLTGLETVLDIACGTGYSSAVLSALAKTVVAVEQDKALAGAAQALVHQVGKSNVTVLMSEHVRGAAAQGPYDAILINGAVQHIPDALFDQLADQGRLLAVCRNDQTGSGKARRYQKINGKISFEDLFDANVPLAPGFAKPPAFVF